MEQRNQSTTANRAPFGRPREAHQRAGHANEKAMDFLTRQATFGNKSTFEAGRFFGACEALCMAGVITAGQWQQLDDLANKGDIK